MDRANSRSYQTKTHATAVIGSKRGGEKSEKSGETDEEVIGERMPDEKSKKYLRGCPVGEVESLDNIETIRMQGGEGSCCMGKKETLKLPNHDPMAVDNPGGPLNSWVELLNQGKGVGGREAPGLDSLCNNKSVGPSDLRPMDDMINVNGKINKRVLGNQIESDSRKRMGL
ncbi:hypothetical protein L6452_04023 [Arctium lappa]|uniref:Uncharacterized protein n=1 Tax=Arctium lappa TaxID=4217 RepID=A0ACB9FNH8_ARCLA|nr:hypothetical protein L6452_04023 [Arctium lappa]